MIAELGSPRSLKTNRRRAYTLVEMVVVIGTGAAMLGVGVGLLGLLLRLDRGSRDEARQQTALTRLADQFRRDVHAADRFAAVESPQSEDSPPAWQFWLEADRVVEYRAEQDELIRTEQTGDQVLRQESFRLPVDSTVSIGFSGGDAPGIVGLQIVPKSGGPPALIARSLRIDALLAKDRRFLKPEKR